MAQEKTYENKIKKFLEAEGCYFVKFFANAYTKKGVPDIICCCNGYFVGLEVKADNGKPTELQIKNCEQIRASGGFAWIVYPSAFTNIKELIRNLKKEIYNRESELILK
jgi:Holliday junction resolvase